jgi:hypothetical protein
MKNTIDVAHVQPAAAINDDESRQPISRANRNAPSAARKCVIAAENVSPIGTGSNNASNVSGLYGADCADCARMSPERMNGFHNGHSPCANDHCTALRHGIICA